MLLRQQLQKLQTSYYQDYSKYREFYWQTFNAEAEH
jgi:hypothetical protein